MSDESIKKVPCQYCGKEYAPQGLKAHENSCSERPKGVMKVITH